MLKYIVKNKKSNNKAMEFYYRQCREVVSITQGQQIMFARKDQNTGLAEVYYLNNYYLGIRQLTAKGTMITIIKDDQAEGFLVYETFDNQGSLVSKQVLDENLDVVSSTSYEDGITVTYQRSDGLITCQTINNKTVLEVTYNDNTVAYIDEFGGTTVYTLDPVWGNVVTIQLPDGRVIQDTYDVGGSALTKKTFGNSEAAPTYEFSYENGYLKSISGAQNMSYGFDYTKGELTGVTKCGSSVEEHVHSLTQTTSYYPKQNAPLYSIVRKYDKYGRLESIDNDALQCSYSVYPKFKNNGDLDENVDNSSSRLAMTKDNVSNETARYCYTDAGLLVEKTVTAKNDFSLKKSTETFEYDDLSRLHKTFYENHQTNQERSESIHYEPVLANQLSAHIEQDGNDDCKYTYVARLNNVVKVKVDFPERDELQKVTRQDMTFGGLHLAKKYTYEGSRVQSVDHVQVTTNSNGTKTERTLEKNQYAYDDAGRITQTVCEFENNANSKTITYAYDSFGRLQRENNPFLDKSFVFCYDDIGNLTNVITYAYAAPDGVLGHPISTQAFTYNADRLTAFGNKAITYNANGEMASFDGWDYSWSKGKLSRMEKTIGGSSTWAVKPSIPSIPSLPDIKAYSFTYNAFGQRTSMSYSFTEGSSSLSPVQVGDVTAYTKAFQYDHAGRLISESNVKTLYAEGSASTSIVYLYDGNTMIGMQYTANGTDNLYYFHRNLQGDVIGIYDTNGVLKVKYNYDAWGNCTIDNTQTTDIALAKANPIRYRGYYYDQDTGLYYLNARYYSPELRRFISPDDTAYLDPENVDGLNLYAYCYNDPVNYADPSGNSPTKWWEWALAGVTTAGLIVGTIFTGGLLGGAFLGAAIGAGVSLGTQAVQGQLNWAQFALDIGVGAISGMLGVSSASRLITTSVGFLIGGASNFASQLISYKSINNIVWWKVIVSACIGGIAGFMGGAGNQNAQVLNSATKVSKAMNSVNKVLGRMNTGYYSSARYAKTALTNVSNRLGKAIIQEQTKMLIESMLWYGGSTIGNNFLMGMF